MASPPTRNRSRERERGRSFPQRSRRPTSPPAPSGSGPLLCGIHPWRRNQAAPCQSLVNGMSMIQLLQTDLLSYSTKPEMRRRVGMDKTLIHLLRTPGLRGWNLMLQNQARRNGFVV